jgi:hypothetical protein
MIRRPTLVLCLAIGAVSLHYASIWWERAYATASTSRISPDNCLRLDSFEPFWLLPSFLQTIPDQDPRESGTIGRPWQTPIFFRLFEISTGDFLGESVIFDAAVIQGEVYWDWGTWDRQNRREVSVGTYTVAKTRRCSDDVARQTILRYRREEGEFLYRRTAPP